MANNRAIGLFDSGVGGLTVAAEIFSQLPNEEIYYFGDTAHIPYGSKTPDELKTYATEILEFLRQKQIKMAVMACNTSSAVVLPRVKDKYEYEKMSKSINPYGDGFASKRITDAILYNFGLLNKNIEEFKI